jgi:hypothetical protein
MTPAEQVLLMMLLLNKMPKGEQKAESKAKNAD